MTIRSNGSRTTKKAASASPVDKDVDLGETMGTYMAPSYEAEGLAFSQ